MMNSDNEETDENAADVEMNEVKSTQLDCKGMLWVFNLS